MTLISANIETAASKPSGAAALEANGVSAPASSGTMMAAGSRRRAMPPPTPSLASRAAMPASGRSVSAPADSRQQQAVCTAMFANANNGSPPNT